MTLRTGIAASYYDFLNQLEAALCSEGHAWGLLYTGAGNGTLTGLDGTTGGYRGDPATIAEAFTITALDANRFQVIGSVAGDLGLATAGLPFESERLRFQINAGSLSFVAGDRFTLNTSPPWTLIRRIGVRNPTLRTGNFSNLGNLFDGTVDTFGACPVANLPATAGIEMIGPTAVRAITLGVADAINRGVSAFELQSSVDGSTWTKVQGWTGVRWASTRARQTFVVTGNPTAARYWRVLFTAASGGTVLDCSELSFQTDLNADFELEERAQWIVRAPGLDGRKAIFIGAELYEDPARAAYNLNWYGFRFHNPLLGVRSQVNNSGLRNLPLRNGPFGYWLAINGQRVVIVAKIGTVYVSAYLGFGLPYEPPSDHEFPMLVGACGSNEGGTPDATDPNFRAFFDPGRYGLVAYYPDNVWRPHANRYQSSNDNGDNETQGKVYPSAMSTDGARAWLRENLDGSTPLLPLILQHLNVRHHWGEFDGCAWTTGFNTPSESRINRDSAIWLVFQNTFRTSPDNYFALRMD
ncbi:discoidin domain-containing protein [Lysobacter sp. Hz 25]|uniref:discoidin domain-containing protein n=1 Tax=Lysobacter sp. Hz 25 TaxID=3383698 RepID=UPI0038D472C1